MPRIPLYNQGLGPTVQLATGQLSPRASGGAAASVGETYARLGQTVSQVGDLVADFERVRQQAEADEIAGKFELENIDEPANILNSNQSLRDVSSYRAESAKLRDTVLNQVDGLNLSNFQKRIVREKANNRLNLQFASGESQAFDRFLFDASETFNQRAINAINQSVADPTLEGINVDRYAVDYDAAIAKGLSPTYTPREFQKQINLERLYSMSVDENLNDGAGLDSLNAEVSAVLDGTGRYAGLSGDEKRDLLAVIDPKINYLEKERVIELTSQYQDLRTSMSMPIRGDTSLMDIRNRMYSVVDEIGSLGQTADAKKLKLETDVLYGNMKALDFLAFATPEKIKELLDKNYGAMIDMQNTDRAYEAAFQYQSLQELVTLREKAIADDLALYITDAYRRTSGTIPSPIQIIQKAREMGIDENLITPLTGAQVESISASINNAETPADVQAVFASVTTNSEAEPYVMRQIMGSGVSIAMNYIASNPTDITSRQLFNAFRPDALQITPSKTARDLVRTIVIGNDDVKTHNRSMLGGSYANFDDENIVASASDSRSYADHRRRHNDMVTQLAIFLISEDGKMLTGEEKITPSQIEEYVEQATSVYTNRYDYIESFPNSNVSLRLPKALSDNKRTIQKGLENVVSTLKTEDLHYSSISYSEGTPEYNIEKQRYLDEVQDGYGWITSNDERTVILVDSYGGIVFQEIENDFGEIEVVPITRDLQSAFNVGTDVEEAEKVEAESFDIFVP